MDPIKHDLYMFVFLDHYIPAIYPFMKDFLWVTVNNLYVITSKVQIQFFHYFLLQIIQHFQLTTYHHVVAFDTQPSRESECYKNHT